MGGGGATKVFFLSTLTQSVVKQTCLIRTVGRLYGESADDIPAAESAVESADSGIESADSTTDSTANSAKVGVWVWALRPCNS